MIYSIHSESPVEFVRLYAPGRCYENRDEWDALLNVTFIAGGSTAFISGLRVREGLKFNRAMRVAVQEYLFKRAVKTVLYEHNRIDYATKPDGVETRCISASST